MVFPASPLAKINLVEAIPSTSRNIVPRRIIEGKDANSRGLFTKSDIIRRTIPRVIFKLIAPSITTGGTSIINIRISPKTNTPKAISLIGIVGAPPALAKSHSLKFFNKRVL